MLINSLDKLKVVKESSSYIQCICPVCGEKNLKISKSSTAKGAYRCWSNYCSPKEIRKALDIYVGYSPYAKDLIKSPYEFNLDLAKVKERSQLENPILFKNFDYEYTESYKIIYSYSDTQRVLRINGKKKKIFLQYKDGDKFVPGVGFNTWQLYKYGIEEILKNPSANTVLFVEGEKTCESVKARKIAAITAASHCYSPSTLYRLFFVFFNTFPHIKNVMVVPDHDAPGYYKADLVAKVCWLLKKNAKIVFMSEIFPEDLLFEGADLADFDFSIDMIEACL